MVHLLETGTDSYFELPKSLLVSHFLDQGLIEACLASDWIRSMPSEASISRALRARLAECRDDLSRNVPPSYHPYVCFGYVPQISGTGCFRRPH